MQKMNPFSFDQLIRRTGLLTVGLLTAGLLFTSVDTSSAQTYDEKKVVAKYDRYQFFTKNTSGRKKQREIATAWKGMNTKVNSSLSSGSFTKSVSTWISEVRFGEMASNRVSALRELSKNRGEVLKMIGVAKGTAKTRVVDLVLTECEAIANGNYHPAARVNAIRLMASIKDREVDTNRRRPPRYSEKALAKVLILANSASAPQFVKAACLNGFAEVAALDGQLSEGQRIQPGTRKGIVDFAMKTLSDQGNNLQSGTVSGYLARRSVQILGDLNLAAVKDPQAGAVKTALQKVASNSGADVWARFDAMNGLYMLGLQKNELQPFTRNLGKLVVLASKAEAAYIPYTLAKVKMHKKVQKEVKTAKADGGGSGGRGGAAGGGDGKGGMADFGAGGSTNAGTGSTAELYEGVLLPHHLSRVRTNVKNAVNFSRQILGTGKKAKRGLAIDFRSDNELARLISDMSGPMDQLLSATDIGLDIRRRKGEDDADNPNLSPLERKMMKAHNFERVPYEIGKAAANLEAVVGKVELPAKPN